MKIVDDAGDELPWDGKTYGNLLVRGPWVIRSYYKAENDDPLEYDAQGNGWFPTGDVATIDADGFMQITDRSKDVIKSGGEWISSIDLENLAIGHPAVANAAVIGVAHPKWDERPLLIVVRKPGTDPTAADILSVYEGKIAKWWTPDDVQFVEAIPLGRHRQDPQDQAARAVPGLPPAHGLTPPAPRRYLPVLRQTRRLKYINFGLSQHACARY